MNKQDLFDAMDGIMAYDEGCRSSGIYQELLREKIKSRIREPDGEKLLTEFIKEVILSDQSIEQGYNIKDVKSFITWLDWCMEYSI